MQYATRQLITNREARAQYTIGIYCVTFIHRILLFKLYNINYILLCRIVLFYNPYETRKIVYRCLRVSRYIVHDERSRITIFAIYKKKNRAISSR